MHVCLHTHACVDARYKALHTTNGVTYLRHHKSDSSPICLTIGVFVSCASAHHGKAVTRLACCDARIFVPSALSGVLPRVAKGLILWSEKLNAKCTQIFVP